MLIAGLAGCVPGVATLSAPAADKSATLKVMTFNLRFASTNRPHSWDERRPLVKKVISRAAPDLIGTQEGVYHQLKDVAADLPKYAWIGLGREGGSRGEFMAVFYRKDRFDPLEFDHYWLSDTPDVIGSTTWGHKNRRMVTWVKFLDRKSRQQFYFINTHLDHEVQPAREKGAALILERVKALKTDLPVVLVGDFNAAAETNRAYHILVNTEGFHDSWITAQERKSEVWATFHGYREPRKGGARIDWILHRGPVTAESAEILWRVKDEQYPSDHFPVVARLRLGSSSR